MLCLNCNFQQSNAVLSKRTSHLKYILHVLLVCLSCSVMQLLNVLHLFPDQPLQLASEILGLFSHCKNMFCVLCLVFLTFSCKKNSPLRSILRISGENVNLTTVPIYSKSILAIFFNTTVLPSFASILIPPPRNIHNSLFKLLTARRYTEILPIWETK